MQKTGEKSTLILGLVVIVLGLFLLGGILKLFDANGLLANYWPLFTFFIGTALIGSKEMRTVGYGLMWVSGLIMFRRLGVFASGAGSTILVLILILTGLVLVTWAASHLSHPSSE